MSPGSDGEPSYSIPDLIAAITAPSTSSLDSTKLRQSLGLSYDRTDLEEIKKQAREEMEREFLSKVTDLEGEELWMWQTPNPITIPIPTPSLPLLPPTHHIIPTLSGLSGHFSSWKETYAPPPAPPPTVSSSMDRAPGAGSGGMTFVRGKGNYVPFRPGGMEDAYKDRDDGGMEDEDYLAEPIGVVVDDPDSNGLAVIEKDAEETNKIWKSKAPGLTHGLKINDADEFLKSILGEEEFKPKMKRKKRFGRNGGMIGVGSGMDEGMMGRDGNGQANGEGMKNLNGGRGEDKDIDDLLPITRLPAPRINRKRKVAAKREWAHVVDVNQELLNFHELVPSMAHAYPFELDTFQKEAVYHLEMGDSVFVAAHTSAGKTVVAEYAIALAMKHMTRAIYTSPIKALSNQKFRDFKTTFQSENVGILTGDVQINPEGACLIMTTEILRSMLYKGADLIRDVEFVIFDEVHYVNDAERGVVWEEVIIMLPEHISIILLSATVPNTKEFAAWVGRTKKRDIYVISTPKRPVPLEHYLWAGKEMHKIVDAKGQFLGEGYKAAGESLRRKQEKEREAAGLPPLQRTGGRGLPARGGAKTLPNGRGGGGAGRGVAPAPRGRGGGNAGVTTFGARGGAVASFDKNLWVTIVQHLRKADLLPVVVFTFSKKRCEENAASLSGTDLCVASEKSEVHLTVERALTRLKGSDKKLPQISRMRELLNRGIGVHHGGLLPIVKEVVEILFARGLVKVLFATETFAMGVNMPAKSVVFSGTRKHDGHSFRELTPGEYTQMAGRAGRRGLDTTGTVIITSDGELPESATLTTMMLGVPNKLISQFRLTYNMILNLLRVEALRVEEMIKRSFSENASQSLAPDQQRAVAAKEKVLAGLPKVECPVCLPDIEAFYDISAELARLNLEVVQGAAAYNQAGRNFSAGRVVMLYDTHFRGNLAVILRPAAGVSRPETAAAARPDILRSFHVLALVSQSTKSGEDDVDTVTAPPYWPASLQKDLGQEPTWEILAVDTSSINVVVDRTVKVESVAILNLNKADAINDTLESLSALHQDLTSVPVLPEVEWSRMRMVDFQEVLRQRNKLVKRIDGMACRLCADFDEHYETLHEVKLVEAELIQLKLALSDQNLELLPDYNQRVDVLKQLKFIDDNATVLLKGRVACEINSANELVLTEVILENILAPYTAAEAVALLSIFVFVEKSNSQPIIPDNIKDGLDIIYNLADSIERVQDKNGVSHDEFQSKFKPGLVEVVYEWARGMPFDQITDLTDVPEGTIVRCITRLDETCREVRDAARVIGDRDLFAKMEEAQNLIKRDIVFAASLYF